MWIIYISEFKSCLLVFVFHDFLWPPLDVSHYLLLLETSSVLISKTSCISDFLGLWQCRCFPSFSCSLTPYCRHFPSLSFDLPSSSSVTLPKRANALKPPPFLLCYMNALPSVLLYSPCLPNGRTHFLPSAVPQFNKPTAECIVLTSKPRPPSSCSLSVGETILMWIICPFMLHNQSGTQSYRLFPPKYVISLPTSFVCTAITQVTPRRLHQVSHWPHRVHLIHQCIWTSLLSGIFASWYRSGEIATRMLFPSVGNLNPEVGLLVRYRDWFVRISERRREWQSSTGWS